MDDSYNEFPLSSLTFQGVYGLQKMVCDCKELSFTTNMALPCSQGKYFDREFCTELGLKFFFKFSIWVVDLNINLDISRLLFYYNIRIIYI